MIAEIETDKATLEVEAFVEGTVAKFVVPAGTEGVKVNALIAILAGEGEDVGAAAKGGNGGAAPQAEAKPTQAEATQQIEVKQPAPAGGDGQSQPGLNAEAYRAPSQVGGEAGRRAVSQLGARKLKSRTAPVILENRVATQLLGPLVGAMAGPAVARGVSFLKDRMGERVLSEAFTLVDDPLRPRGLGSTPFDDEGVAVQRLALVEQGVLRSWLLNTSSAAQLGLETTGHASRGLAGPAGVSGHNLTVEPGDRDLAGLMADAGTGLLITSMFGPSLNPNTGDWSAGVAGQWFENGEIVHAVNEVTIAGNLLSLYQRLVPGSDLELRSSNNSPSLLIDAVAIAGS